MRWCVICLLLGALCCGCAKKPAKPTATDVTVSGGEPSATPPAAGLVEHFASKLPTIAPLEQPVASAVASFSPKDTVAEADVPNQPVTGQVNGQPFICRYAAIMPDEEARQPTLWPRFSGQPRPADGRLSLTDTNVNLEITRKPEVGTWTRALRAEDRKSVV